MSLFETLLSSGVAGLISGVGQAARDIRQAITGEISPDKRYEIEMKLMEIEFSAMKAQAEINLAEAQHPSVFVSGWRPSIGWICATGLAYHFIVHPTFIWIVSIAGLNVTAPKLDVEGLMSLVIALLGIGGLRTFEKIRGVTR